MPSALAIVTATTADADAVARLRNAAAAHLTREFGGGAWSGTIGAAGVLRGINSSRVLIARHGATVVGTLRLASRKPWSIDVRCFASARRPLYLVDMAVLPGVQRQGIGRALLDAAVRTAGAWAADALRLDAYDHPAGAGGFYEKCGFTRAGRNGSRDVPLVYYQMILRGSP